MINVDDRYVTEVMPIIGRNGHAVLFAIAKHLNAKKQAFPSKATIRKYTKLGRDTVDKTISELVKSGHLERKQRRTNNGRKLSTNLYKLKCKYIKVYIEATDRTLSDEDTENQYTENENTDLQDTEKQYADEDTENQYPVSILKTSTQSINKDIEVLTSTIEVLTKEKEKEKSLSQKFQKTIGDCRKKIQSQAEEIEQLKAKLKKEKEKNSAKKESSEKSEKSVWQKSKEVLNYLNQSVGATYPINANVARPIQRLIESGTEVQSMKNVIDLKIAQWTGKKYEANLTIKTLFGDKFYDYEQEAKRIAKNPQILKSNNKPTHHAKFDTSGGNTIDTRKADASDYAEIAEGFPIHL